MADITFTLSPANMTRLINATCVRGGYSATLPDGGANPETKAQFAKRFWKNELRQVILDEEARQAAIDVQNTFDDPNIT